LKRQTCPACLRAKITCICHLVSTVNTDIEVLILQHPNEVFEAKGTARLLHLSLPNSKLLTGELFEDAALNSHKNTILLYPITAEDHSIGIKLPPELPANWLNQLHHIRLIIIDGTWRKSRKILCKNPYLQTLPRLVLDDLPAGQYTIRKARKPHQLSTMEAASTALAQMEGNSAKYEPLNSAFLTFNAMLAEQMKR
jgi:DTW domain-containing protein YfiP